MVQQIEDHFRKNQGALVKRVKYRVGTQWDAEDVVQEAYYRALKYRFSFIEGTNMDFWFNRILKNAITDYMKAEREYAGMEDVDDDEGEPVENENIPDSIKREIRHAISQLPDNQREVVELHLVYGYELKQILQIVDMKYQNINQILKRFKRSIKDLYMQ